jgi:peptide/nickel transport system permease protein
MWWVRFLAIRGLRLLVTLAVSSMVIFGAIELAPGSALAALSGGRSLSPDALAQLTARYHLNEPLVSRYLAWLGAALHGDLGISIQKREEVNAIVMAGAETTLTLVVMAAVIVVVLGIGIGMVAGLRERSNNTVMLAGTAVMAAVPTFVASALLLTVFSAMLGWFPALGTGNGSFPDLVWHLVMPSIALAIAAIAIVARVVRASVREELRSDHVLTAVSRGIPYPTLVRRHVLRNAGAPIVTITGISIAGLVAVSAVIETAFGLHGLGAFLVQAAATKDLAVVQGISIVFVTAFVVVNAVVDVIAAVIDPRLRQRAAA